MRQEPPGQDEEAPFDNVPKDASLISMSMGGGGCG